jgi:triacylglycerol lipase
MPILSKQNRDWAELFGRFSDAAYFDSEHGNYPGLERLKAAEGNEPPTLIDISATDTQALAAHWSNDLVIAFRGTEDNATDAATDAKLARVNNHRGPGKVHRGFQSAANSAYKAVTSYIRSNRTQRTRIFLCGHSLGGALATLTASWLQNDASILHPRAVFTYGAPRVGNEDFVKNYHRQGLSTKTCSFLAGNDIVRHKALPSDPRHGHQNGPGRRV